MTRPWAATPKPNTKFQAAARAYIARLRNKDKQAYAWAYLAYLDDVRDTEPEPTGLTPMAAQAVRNELIGIEANYAPPTRRFTLNEMDRGLDY